MAMKTVVVANQKGGVGKTTTVRGLGFHALDQGKRTLLIDLDPQRNLTKTALAVRQRNLGHQPIPGDALTASGLFDSQVKKQPLDCGNGLFLIAADRDLVDVAKLPLETMINPRTVLARFKSEFDVAFIDTAPTLGQPLYAALIAGDCVVCPCDMDQDAIDGLTDLFEDINRVQQLWNPELQPLGVLATKVNSRRSFDVKSLKAMRGQLGDLLIDTVLYERAATKYAKHHAVWHAQRGESHMRAAREMRAVCTTIFDKAMI